MAIAVGLLACLVVFALMPRSGGRPVVVDLGEWVGLRPSGIDHAHYQFAVEFEFDVLSVSLALLSFLLCGTIGAFAASYLHREPGFNRFFVLFALFLLGMVTAALADTIETLFFGWELVGLSGALLVAFFQERPAPPRNGLRVWIVYRISDAPSGLPGSGERDRRPVTATPRTLPVRPREGPDMALPVRAGTGLPRRHSDRLRRPPIHPLVRLVRAGRAAMGSAAQRRRRPAFGSDEPACPRP